jgi:hypothetical protein
MSQQCKKKQTLIVSSKNLELSPPVGLEVVGNEATTTKLKNAPKKKQRSSCSRLANTNTAEINPNSTSASRVSSKMNYLKRYVANGLTGRKGRRALQFGESSWNRIGGGGIDGCAVAVSVKCIDLSSVCAAKSVVVNQALKCESNDLPAPTQQQQQQQQERNISQKSYFTYSSMRALNANKNGNQESNYLAQPSSQHCELSIIDLELKIKGTTSFQQQKQLQQSQQSQNSNSGHSRRVKLINTNAINDNKPIAMQIQPSPAPAPAIVDVDCNSGSHCVENCNSSNQSLKHKNKNYHKYLMKKQQNKKQQLVASLSENNPDMKKSYEANNINFSIYNGGLNNSLLIKQLK